MPDFSKVNGAPKDWTRVFVQFSNNYIKLKILWGYRLNLNYLLSSVTSQDTTTSQNNATTYRKYEHTQFHSGMDTGKLCIYIPLFESFLNYSCTKQSG